jgi:hypothetical protein
MTDNDRPEEIADPDADYRRYIDKLSTIIIEEAENFLVMRQVCNMLELYHQSGGWFINVFQRSPKISGGFIHHLLS